MCEDLIETNKEIAAIEVNDAGFKSKIDFVLSNTINHVRKEVMVA